MEDLINCFSCRALCLDMEGDQHKYMLSSPGCWALFCEVLEKEYADIWYARAHHFTVDAYACQHPGKADCRQAVNSVGIHLSCLHMLLEKGMPLREAGNYKNRFSQFHKHTHFIEYLKPPKSFGETTIYDVWNLDNKKEYFDKCKEWATSTWFSWKDHHETIRFWTEEFLKQEPNKFQMGQVSSRYRNFGTG